MPGRSARQTLCGAVAVAAGALLLTSCAVAPGDPSGSLQNDGLPGVVDGAAQLDPAHEGVVMPLGSFQLLPAEYAVLRRASEVLVQECVVRAGFEVDKPARSAAEQLSVTHFSFGVWTQDRAAAYGYGLAPRSSAEAAFEVALATGDRDRLAAVRSCNVESEASELNDGMESSGTASQGDSESWDQMEADPRSKPILEAHRACMAGRGLQIADDW